MNTENKLGQEVILPKNILAEKIVLAGIIANSNLLYKIVGVIEPEIFFDDKHREIYISIIETYTLNGNVDMLSVINQLTKHENNKYVVELREIERLGRTLVNNEVFEEYLYLLIDKFVRRSIITNSFDLLNIVANEMVSMTTILNQFEQLFLDLNKHNCFSTSELKLTSLLPSMIKGIEKKYRNGNVNNGLFSGFTSLDHLTEGFQKSDLIIIASRPGMGKTAFVLNIARNITKNNDHSLAFFSLEMTAEQLGYRILSSESQVHLSKLKNGNLNTKEWIQIQKAVKILSNTKLYIDDTPKITITKLKNKIYKLLQNNNKLDGVIIDYLQLIESDTRNENRYQSISSITRALKIIAREFNIPLIVLSQLSRNVESRNNKRPLLADLRESGCVASQSYISTNQQEAKISALPVSLYNKAFVVNNNNTLVSSSIKKIHTSQNKFAYQLITRSGYYLEASANHKILTQDGWKALSTLKVRQSLSLAKVYREYHSNDHTEPFQFLKQTFEEIESININKKQHLLDIEMDEIHNFIANKIVVHNSIEQDADLVCMLYREAYYDRELLNKNITEISILKHRNGPTGNIELKFNPQFAEFTESYTP